MMETFNENYTGTYTPCILTRKHFILKPETKAVQDINQFTFEKYAKYWAIHYRFFPVMRFLKDNTLYIKFYYAERRKNEFRELTDFANAFYQNFVGIGGPNNRINFLSIPFSKSIPIAQLTACTNMIELEKIHLATLDDSSWVGCNTDGTGGVTAGGEWTLNQFYKWNQLLADGYLNPEYEAACRLEKLEETGEI